MENNGPQIDYAKLLSSPLAEEENIDFSKEKLRTEQIKNDDLENANKHRRLLVCWMIIVVSTWLLITAGIVIAQLCMNQLSDTVLCALLTTTTVNVLGLAVIVLRGLFRIKETL